MATLRDWAMNWLFVVKNATRPRLEMVVISGLPR